MKNIRDIITQTPPQSTYSTGISREEYVSLIGMNPSSLASGLVGHDDVDPASIKLAWESPDTVDRTAAQQDRLDRGTLAHLMVLQPELVQERVAVWRGGRRSTNEYDDFTQENSGKLLITASDFAMVALATKDLKLQPKVAELLRGLDHEVAMVSSDPCKALGGHMLLKGQVDGVNVDKCIIVDLKTTEAGISQRQVERTIRDFHYREKMAKYRRLMARATGVDAEKWQCWNLFLSMSTPPRVVLEKFNSVALEWGEERMQQAQLAVEQCLAAKEWPMYVREYFMGVEMYEMDDGSGVEVDYE